MKRLLAFLFILPALALAQTRTVTTDASGVLKQNLELPTGKTLTLSGDLYVSETASADGDDLPAFLGLLGAGQAIQKKSSAFTADIGGNYYYSGAAFVLMLPTGTAVGQTFSLTIGAGSLSSFAGAGISGASSLPQSPIPYVFSWSGSYWTVDHTGGTGTGVYVRQTAPTIDGATLTNTSQTPEYKNSAFTAAVGRTYVYAGSPQTMTVPNGTANGQRITLVVLSGSVTLSGTGISGSVVPSGVPTQIVWNSSTWTLTNSSDTGTGAYVRAASPTMTTDALLSGGGSTFPSSTSLATRDRGDVRWAQTKALMYGALVNLPCNTSGLWARSGGATAGGYPPFSYEKATTGTTPGTSSISKAACAFPKAASGSGIFDQIDWSKKVTITFAVIYTSTSTNGNARISFGKNTSDGAGALSRKGLSMVVSGGSSYPVFYAHNGTSLSAGATSSTPLGVGSNLTNIEIESDGAGNVIAWVNGTQSASFSGGPTSVGGSGDRMFQIESSNGADSTDNVTFVYFINYYIR